MFDLIVVIEALRRETRGFCFSKNVKNVKREMRGVSPGAPEFFGLGDATGVNTLNVER